MLNVFTLLLVIVVLGVCNDCQGESFDVEKLKVGCFAERAFDREFSVSAGNYDTAGLTPYKCTYQCGKIGYNFAALQNGTLCFCGENIGTYGASLACNKTCSGDVKLFCGGEIANSVYNASYYDNKLVILDSGNWELFSRVNMTVSLLNSSETNSIFSVDVGGGEGFSTGTSGWQSYRTTMWGKMSIKAKLVRDGPIIITQRETYISATVKHAFFECPSVIATEEEFSCTAGLYQGTKVNGNVSLGLKDSTSFALADPVPNRIGLAVPQWPISGTGSDYGGVFLMASQQVHSEALVLAVELYGHVPGNVRMFVLRPSCDPATETYCTGNRSCLAKNKICETRPQSFCNAGTLFCLSKRSCHDTNKGNCSSLSANPFTLPILKHTIVHVLEPIAIKTGYNLHVLDDDKTFKVTPGDIVGWVSEGGMVAHLTGKDAAYQIPGMTDSDVKAGLNLNQANSPQVVKVLFMLSFIIAEPARFAFRHTYDISGVFTAFVQFTNAETKTTASSSKVIYVQKPITYLTPNYLSGFDTFGVLLNRSVEVSVNASAATNITVTWYHVTKGGNKLLQQQTLVDSQSIHGLNVSFNSKGTQKLFVEASNNISSINATMYVKVLDEGLSGFTAGLDNPSKKIYKGVEVNVNASVATGANVKYKWIFDGLETDFDDNPYKSYSFRRHGALNVTVIATNLVSELRASFTVLVFDSISIETPAWGVVGLSVTFKCPLVTDGNFRPVFFRDYKWQFGDGAKNDITGTDSASHTYFKAGVYNVSCLYLHRSIPLVASTEVLILEPVTGPRIKNVSAVELYDKKTFIALSASGNNLTYEWYIRTSNNTIMKFYVCTQNTLEYQFNATGSYHISVNVSNAMSSKSSSAVFQVQEQISGLGMTSYPNPAPSNTTITFNVTKGTGSNVSYRLDFGDGFVVQSFNDPYVFQRTFLSGAWQVILTGINAVSHMIIFYNVTVQDPVGGVNLTVLNSQRFYSRHVVPVGSPVRIHSEVIEGTDVYFKAYYDTERHPRSCKKYYSNKRPAGGAYITLSHTFQIKGFYNVTVSGENLISKNKSWVALQAQERIQGLAVSSFPVHAQPGESLTLKFSHLSGSNVTYSVKFDDGSPNVTTTASSLSHRYSSPRVAIVTVTASNQLSMVTAQKTIAVQYRIQGLEFTREIAAAALGNHSIVTWTISSGSDVTYVIDFGDSSQSRVVKSNAVGAEFQANYTYTSPGKYSVTIDAYNLVGPNQTISSTAIVEEPISGLLAYTSLNSIKMFVEIEISMQLSNGSNVFFHYDFGDGSVGQDTTQKSVKYRYKKYGTFIPWVRATNKISTSQVNLNSSITVNKPTEPLEIKGLVVLCEPTILGNSSSIRIDFSYGFLFQCTINYGDRTEGRLNDSDLHVPILHKYRTTGSFEISVTCWNEKGSNRAKGVANVDTILTGLNFTATVKHAIFGEPVTIHWKWLEGTNVMFTVFLEGKRLTDVDVKSVERSGRVVISSGDVTEPGVYTLLLNASNSVTAVKTLSLRVHMERRLEGLSMSFNSHSRSGLPLVVYVSCTMGSQLSILWEFGDNNATYREQQTSNDVKRFSANHTYAQAGVYTLSAQAWNYASRDKITRTVTIMNPVQGYSLIQSNVVYWPESRIRFKLERNSTSIPPDDARYEIDYGNGVRSGTIKFDSTLVKIEHEYNYPASGCFNVKVTMSNLVSRVTLNAHVKVIENIADLEIIPLNSKSSATPEQRGGGVGQNVFPSEYPVILVAKHSKGTCVQYDWVFGNSSARTHHSFIEHSFPWPGNYSVTVTASNSVSSQQRQTYVVLKKTVIGLFLTSNSPAKAGHKVTFVVFCKQPGQDTKFVAEVENSKTLSLPVPKRESKIDLKSLVNPLTAIPFDPTNYFTTVFNYTYSENRIYTVTVKARNEASHQEARTSVVITNKDCSLPRVTILGGGETAHTAPDMLYDRSFTLMSEVESDCEGEYAVNYNWTLYRADSYQVVTFNTTFPPDNNRKISLPQEVRIDLPSIIIPKTTLKPGLYIFELTVTLGKVRLTNADLSYISIADPGIFARIAGGSLRSNGWADQLVLNASESRDATSSSPNNRSLLFKWFCRQQGTSKIFIGSGGCFGSGEGLIEFDGPVYKIRAQTLYEHVNYVFTVNVSAVDEPGRTAAASQTVIVLSGQPPNVKIRCKANCAAKTIASEKLVLETSCSGCNQSQSIYYLWTVEPTDGSQAPKIWPDYAMTSQVFPSLVILPGALTGGKSYRFRVEAKKENGVSGFAEHHITTNLPPRHGRCNVTPKEGISLDTEFNFTCNGWQDDDKPLSYELLCARPEKSLVETYKLVKHGPLPLFNGIVLPPGDEARNHTLKVRIRVKDVYGAWSKAELVLKVMPFSVTDVVKEAGSLLADGSPLSKALGSKDLQKTTQLMSALALAINRQHNGTSGNSETRELTKVRDQMLTSLAQLPITNLQSIEQASSTIQSITDVPTQISPKAQESAAKLFTKLSDALMQQAQDGVDGGVIEHVAREGVYGQSNVLKASSMTVRTLVDPGHVPQNNVVVSTLVSALDQTSDSILYSKLPGEKNTVLKSPDLTLVMGKHSPDNLPSQPISSGSKGEFVLPPSNVLFNDKQSRLPYFTISMTEATTNPYSGSNTSQLVKSSTLSLVLKEPSGNVLNVSGLKSEINLKMPQKERPKQQLQNMTQTPRSDGNMVIHKITLPHAEDSIHAEFITANRTEQLVVYVRQKHRPTREEYDYRTLVPDNSSYNGTWNNSNTDLYKLFLSSDVIREAGNYYIGVLPVSGIQPGAAGVLPVNYTFNVFSSGCYYWDEVQFSWSGAGCKVGNQSTYHVTHCQCNHLTWFGADLFIPPNKIDIADAIAKLGNPKDYPAILATFCVIAALYTLALIWARRKDRQDLEKVGLVPVIDNDPSDRYRYEVTVYTGMRKTCSTTAKVSIILAGEEGRTSPYMLKDEYRRVFHSGGVDSFLVTTSESLGSLTYVRVWHDNSGSAPSWYLSQIAIKDVETEEIYYFLCDRWLACDEGDGQVDRLLPVASKEELGEFVHLLKTKTSRDFSDGHLWFSIAFRPPRSRFTRVQRVSCCLTLLLSSMLANVMWYRKDVPKQNDTIFDAGFIQFTWHELVIGIQSSLIVFPINLIIVQIFRHIDISPKRKKQYLIKSMEDTQVLKTRVEPVSKSTLNPPHLELPTSTRKESALSLTDISTCHSISPDILPQTSNPISSEKKKKHGMKQLSSFDDEDELFSRLLDSLEEDLSKGKRKPKREAEPRERDFPDHLSSDIYYYLYKQDTTNKDTNEDEKRLSDSSNISLHSSKPFIPLKTKKRKLPKLKKLLPWWFVYVAWTLCFAMAGVAGFFTLLFGVSFSPSKQEEWLFSFFVSIVQDIFIAQPLKVIGVAVFFALIIKRPQEEDDARITAELAQDEEWLKQSLAHPHKGTATGSPSAREYRPPDETMLRAARVVRFKERKMYSVIREILFYFLFVWIVLMIAYGHRDPYAHFMTGNLQDMFVGHGEIGEELQGGRGQRATITTKERTKFFKIGDVDGFWTWVDDNLIPGLYNGNWYSGAQDSRGFLADRANFVVGGARMRQLRVKKGTCEVAKVFNIESVFDSCNEPYSWSAEYMSPNHYPRWKPTNHSLPETPTNLPWRYQTSADLLTYPFLGTLSVYRGGGYIAELGNSPAKATEVMRDLKSNGWVDKYTRAVFIEFTVYNANSNLYCVVNLLLEFTAAGGALPFVQILATRIDRYVGNFQLFVLACEVAFVLFTVLFTYREVKRMAKTAFREYITEVWTWMEIIQLCLSWAVIVLYFIRFGIDKMIKEQYKTNPNKFINHHYLATTDRIYGYIYAAVVFLMSLKFLRLFRFNRRMSLLGSVLSQSSKEMLHFLIIWGIVFVAFAHFSYLVFSRELHKFHTFIATSETLVSVMLGKFSYQNLERSNRILGPLMFFAYSMGIVFILMNMFVSIIIENFKRVKRDNDLQSNEYEIIDFMVEQLQSWLGVSSWGFLGKNRVGAAPPPQYKRKKKVHKDEELKEKVDRLISLIRTVHFDNEEEDDFLRNDGEITYKVPTRRLSSDVL